MDDKERIEFIIKDKELSNIEFSSITGIAPATISHITSGRSKPTLPIFKGILQGFPDLNPEWVFLGTGSIYRNKVEDNPESEQTTSTQFGSLDLFSSLSNNNNPKTVEVAKKTNVQIPKVVDTTEVKQIIRESMVEVMGQQKRQIVEVRIFFDDGTYEAFSTPKIK